MNNILIVIVTILILSGSGCSSASYSSTSSVQEQRFFNKIKIGMTCEQVRENWGTPDKIINKLAADFDEIWVYVPHWKFKNYLYFKKGILIKGNPNPESLI